MKNIHLLTEKYRDKIIAFRRHIHANPELSGMESGTSAYISNSLKKMGLEPIENVGGYGVIAHIQGVCEGKCVGLRADIDALPIAETTGHSFASQKLGICHACGHDCHTAMLLGMALVLLELKMELHGSIKLIFQPAEERNPIGGAAAMIAAGVLENPHVDFMLGQHMWPQYKSGQAAIKSGIIMASSDRFYITIRGKNSHASQPQDGVDAIAIAGQVICALQTIVSRNINPLDSCVISIGSIQSIGRYNVISAEVRMEGSCRTLNPEAREVISHCMRNIIDGVVHGMGGEYDFQYELGYPPVINDPIISKKVYGAMREQLGEKAIIPENAVLAAEDFSFFANRVPSAFIWLGCRNPKIAYRDTAPLHNGNFNPDEESLIIGTELMVRAAISLLNL